MRFLDFKIVVLLPYFVWIWSYGVCIGDDTTNCGSNITGSYGVVTSMNFPLGAYPNNMECNWTIRTPPRTTLTVHMLFINIGTNCSKEFIEVTESNGNGLRTCGKTLLRPFHTTGNVINLRFASDNKAEFNFSLVGFYLIWEVDTVFELHNGNVTWSEAQNICELQGGSLTEYEEYKISALMADNGVRSVWQGKYFTQWAWSEGCYEFNDSAFGVAINISTNEMKECLNQCSHTNYFGLRADQCYCFDSFIGDQLPARTRCKTTCPGNKDEICGGSDTLTVYMNDICYTNSSTWTGTVARTYSGKQCLPWQQVVDKDYLNFPDQSVLAASNYCRDPDSSSYLWCYVNSTHREQCDIPQCIDKDPNDESSCMVYTGSNDGVSEVMFKSYLCHNMATASCLSAHGNLISNINTNFTSARQSCRAFRWWVPDLRGMVGSQVFRLADDVGTDTYWLGYFRNRTTVLKLPPRRVPSACYVLSNNGPSSTLRETVTTCNQTKPFICQRVHMLYIPTSGAMEENAWADGTTSLKCSIKVLCLEPCEYIIVPVTCGGNLTGTHGEIYSPGYPTGYDAYIHCEWNVVVAIGYHISLSYDLDMEDSTFCRSDAVKIIDHHNHGRIITLCGLSTGTLTTDNNITIRLLSDKTTQKAKGFHLIWTAVTKNPEESGANTGLVVTVVIGVLCIIGIGVLVIAVMYYRRANVTPLQSLRIAFNNRYVNVVTRATSVTPTTPTSPSNRPDILPDIDEDIDHISEASINVSNDSNSLPEDGGSYINITFRKDNSSRKPVDDAYITTDQLNYEKIQKNTDNADAENYEGLRRTLGCSVKRTVDIHEECEVEHREKLTCNRVIYSFAKKSNSTGNTDTPTLDTENIYEDSGKIVNVNMDIPTEAHSETTNPLEDNHVDYINADADEHIVVDNADNTGQDNVMSRQADELETDEDIDHISETSINVSNNSNPQSGDGGSYISITDIPGEDNKLDVDEEIDHISEASINVSIDSNSQHEDNDSYINISFGSCSSLQQL